MRNHQADKENFRNTSQGSIRRPSQVLVPSSQRHANHRLLKMLDIQSVVSHTATRAGRHEYESSRSAFALLYQAKRPTVYLALAKLNGGLALVSMDNVLNPIPAASITHRGSDRHDGPLPHASAAIRT